MIIAANNQDKDSFIDNKLLLYGLAFSVVRVISELKINDDALLIKKNQLLTLIDNDEYSSEFLVNQIIDIALETTKYISVNKESSNKELIHKLIDYIEKNYHRDISIIELSDSLGFSYKYISRYFKDQTRINITDYLNQRRVIAAKNLLQQEKHLKMNDLCKIVGFDNVQTFRRNFKKFEGILPKEI